MKTKIKIEKEVDIHTLDVRAKVRYFEDAIVNGVEDVNGDLMPCMDRGIWKPLINLDTGIIENWTQGKTASVHYKVCDAGCYYLLEEDGDCVLSIEEDYVPKILCPKENGYGDYIIMDIDENGQIANWNPTIEEFRIDL